jgi:hypothetical protein
VNNVVTTLTEYIEVADPLPELTNDLKAAARQIGRNEVVVLVAMYYMQQKQRVRLTNQTTAFTKIDQPHDLVEAFSKAMAVTERRIARVLDIWSSEQLICRWARSIKGIGPILSAGLAAHIDITRAPTAGQVWRFAGLDPSVKWLPKTKRPWNAELKTLCWKVGDSFVKVHNNPGDYYGHIYAQRKAQEIARNDAGEFREHALQRVGSVGKDTEAYKAYAVGKMPPGEVDARAKRVAVKLFLSHWHHVAFVLEYGKEPPRPWVLAHGGHVDYIPPPNWPM